MTINEVVICGRLTKDPELRYTNNNLPIANITVALDRYMGKDKEKQTDYINCVAFQSNAEILSKYFFQGKKVLIKGNLRQSSWDGEDGKKHYKTEVQVEKVDFADDKKKEGGTTSSNKGNNSATSGFTPIDGDDDLPF